MKRSVVIAVLAIVCWCLGVALALGLVATYEEVLQWATR